MAVVAGVVVVTTPAFATGGTLPVPGVPIPGNTTPFCKLAREGFAAEGWAVRSPRLAVLPALEAVAPLEKLIGGRGGGGSGVPVADVVFEVESAGDFGCLRKIPETVAPEAAAAGMVRREFGPLVPAMG